MLAEPGWARYIGASPLLSSILLEALSSNLYLRGKEGSQASFGTIMRQNAVRSGKGYPPPLFHFLEN